MDDMYEGILWIQLLDSNALRLLIYALCYLPPSNSSWWYTVLIEFVIPLKTQVLAFLSYGRMLICGDFNAKIGSLTDVKEEWSLLSLSVTILLIVREKL